MSAHGWHDMGHGLTRVTWVTDLLSLSLFSTTSTHSLISEIFLHLKNGMFRQVEYPHRHTARKTVFCSFLLRFSRCTYHLGTFWVYLTALMSPADQTHVHKLEKYQHLRNMYTFDKYAALPAIWRLPESDWCWMSPDLRLVPRLRHLTFTPIM